MAKETRSRFDPAYAIVRIDDFLGPDAPTERRITIVKVVRDIEEATREVERLNGLGRGPGVLYTWQGTRAETSSPRPLSALEEICNQWEQFGDVAVTAFIEGRDAVNEARGSKSTGAP